MPVPRLIASADLRLLVAFATAMLWLGAPAEFPTNFASFFAGRRVTSRLEPFGHFSRTSRSPSFARHLLAPCSAQAPWKIQADWSQDAFRNIEWLSSSVLSVDLGNSALAHRLGQLCLSWEAEGSSRTKSNIGGFQTNNLAADVDPALGELMTLMDAPLALFLQRRYRGQPPQEISSAEGLSITSRPEHIWANVNRPGHYNRLHEHGPPLLCRAASCVYYPQTDDITERFEDATAIRFVPPASVIRLYDGATVVQVTPHPGQLLMFPTDLLHEVDMSWSQSDPRASIACNLWVRWLDSPLLRSACNSDVIKVQQLLAEAPCASNADGVLGFSAAHIAAEAGHVAVLEVLLDAKANLTAVSKEGWSPLGLAAAQGHLSVVQYLARHETGDLLFTCKVADAARDAQEVDLTYGFAGLHGAMTVASERGHRSVVDFLQGIAQDV